MNINELRPGQRVRLTVEGTVSMAHEDAIYLEDTQGTSYNDAEINHCAITGVTVKDDDDELSRLRAAVEVVRLLHTLCVCSVCEAMPGCHECNTLEYPCPTIEAINNALVGVSESGQGYDGEHDE